MPDFTISNYRWCSTNERYALCVNGSNGARYMVEYGPTPHGPYTHGWSCTCPGFEYRGKCKHIESAKTSHCGYGHDAVMGSPTQMGDTCPKCGAPTSVISVAV